MGMTHAIHLAHHLAVRDEDLPLIDRKSKDRIRKAVEEWLQTHFRTRGRLCENH
jgi:hypothetical protein